MQLTTGSVAARNPHGVLIPINGESRSAAGLLRLVGITKIPDGYGNGAAQELVMVELIATLQFASTTSDSSAAAGGGQ
jgi:hypothetical protein